MAKLTDDFEIVIERPKRGRGYRKTMFKGGHCGCPTLDRGETIKMIQKKCKCSKKNAEGIDEILTPRVLRGGNWLGDIGNWFKNAGKTIKKGVEDAGRWIEKKALPTIKNVAIDAVGSIPGVGAYAKEGLKALDEGRKYDVKKASKEAVKNIPFVGEVAKQAWDDAEAGRKFQLGKALKNQALTSVVDFVPGGKVGKAAAKVVAEKVRQKTGGDIRRVIRHRDGTRTLVGGSGKIKLMKEEADMLRTGGVGTRSQRRRRNQDDPDREERPQRRCGSMSARGALIRKVMKEKGMNLGEASRFIKENGLY